MTYSQTLKWLFEQLPMFQNVGASAYKADLSNTVLLCNHLNNPQKQFKSVHIAGTNGKGSTSSMIASVLMEAGYKVGLYTSPHLKDFRERIMINGKMISKNYVQNFVFNHKTFFEQNSLSFFEMTVGLAFQYFAEKKVDIAIIEVGMGGRLDSTNIIQPLVCAITNIGMDHQQFLGNTIEKITFEKAGIIKEHVPVVIGEFTNESKPVFEKKALENNAPIIFAQEIEHKNYTSELKGDYQWANKKTTIETINILKKHFKISSKNIKDGIANVVSNTKLKGRWQILNGKPKIICDTAHNTHGLSIVLNQIKSQKFDQLHIVLGFVNDKDLEPILKLFPKNAKYYFCKPVIKRGLHTSILKFKASEFELKGRVYKSVKQALKKAKESAQPKDLIFVGGSTFVVAEVV